MWSVPKVLMQKILGTQGIFLGAQTTGLLLAATLVYSITELFPTFLYM